LLFFLSDKGKKATGFPRQQLSEASSKLPCPLCGNHLLKNEKIRSLSYGSGNEKIMHILGCPYCLRPVSPNKRICPVCKKVIPPSGFAIGLMWEKQGKLHLHLTGCTVCKPQYLSKPKPKSKS